MTILGIFLNPEIRTGGHIRCLELFEGLASRGNQVTVVLNVSLAYEPHYFSEIRLAVNYKRNGILPASYIFEVAIKNWLTSYNPSNLPKLVLVFGETHLKAALAVKSHIGIPILFGLQSNTVRESYISLKENIWKPLTLIRKLFDLIRYHHSEKKITKYCDGIVVQSTYDLDDFLSRNKNAFGKSFIIGGNIGLPRFTDKSRDRNTGRFVQKILFMGTLGERKGLRYLIKAFSILCSEGRPNLELHVAGPGTKDQRSGFERYLHKHKLSDAVTFHGRVPTTFPLMESCDIMVIPSLFDSYPDVVLLALHTGIPVIGSRTGGIPDMLKFDELLFPTRNAEAIASILRRCLEDSQYYLKLRELCASRREAFLFDWPASWEKVIAKVIEA